MGGRGSFRRGGSSSHSSGGGLVVLATVDSSSLGSRFGKLGLGSVFDDGLVKPLQVGDQVPAQQEVSAKPEESNPPKDEEEEEVPLATMEQMRKFSERYAKNSKTYFCSDPGVTAVVIKGLAEHKEAYGAPLCPCRHYDDKVAEVAQVCWSSPRRHIFMYTHTHTHTHTFMIPVLRSADSAPLCFRFSDNNRGSGTARASP